MYLNFFESNKKPFALVKQMEDTQKKIKTDAVFFAFLLYFKMILLVADMR